MRRVRRGAGVALLLAMAFGAGSAGGRAVADEPPGIELPEPRRDGSMPVERAIASRRSVRAFAGEALPLAAASQLLWAAQGVTHPDGLRTAPSAGALYPLEVHLVAGDVAGVPAGVYRYAPRPHRLVRVSPGDRRARLARAALGQDWVAEAPAVVVIAAVHERTARKYGERAARYVHIEVGHAAQNVYLQAEALGLGTTLVGAFDDAAVADALGLPDDHRPLALLPVGRPR